MATVRTQVGLLAPSRALRAPVQRSFVCPALRKVPQTQFVYRQTPSLFVHHFNTSSLIRSDADKTGRVNSTVTNASNASSTKTSDAENKSVSKQEEPKPPLMTRVWTSIKKEAIHYYHGFKLLGKEIRISARLQGKLLKGKTLTRRERRQLKRTTQDILRLIPFSVFILIPFMELLLPVALKLFPQMLPSTFVDEFKEEEKKRKLLKVRLEMAKFLQETVKESGITSQKIKNSEEFKVFFRKLRNTGESPSTDDIVRVARLFDNDLTLDNLSRPQLVGMCRYMNINAFGTDNFLRYTLRNRLAKLKQDDRLIEYEGVDSLSDAELVHACASRGIRTSDMPMDRLRPELKQWIDLHLHKDLSGSLLILSKAFAFTRKVDAEGDQMSTLKDTLSTLPDNLVNETELTVSSDVSNKQRLDVLEEQEELIEEEAEQEEEAVNARREAKASEDTNAEPAAEVKEAKPAVPDDVRLTTEQLGELGQALAIISDKSSVLRERQDLTRLMAQNTAMEATEDNPLSKKIRNMIKKIDHQLSEYDAEVGTKMNLVNLGDGGKVAVPDLKKALKVIKHRPSDEAIDVLIDKLDVDHDNWVPLDHIVSLIEGEGLGSVINDQASDLIEKGQAIRNNENLKPRKEDIVADA